MSKFLAQFQESRRCEDVDRDIIVARGSVFSYSNNNSGKSWAEVVVIDNSDLYYVTVKILSSYGINVPRDDIATLVTDHALFRHQKPFDRHAMTTVGARFVIETRKNRLGFNQFMLRELSYGMETWDNFRW